MPAAPRLGFAPRRLALASLARYDLSVAVVLLFALALSAIGCALVAAKLARARGRSPARWAAFTVAVGITIYVVEEFVWTRPDGDAAAPAGFDMQALLPLFAMLGAAFLITQLPSRADTADNPE